MTENSRDSIAKTTKDASDNLMAIAAAANKKRVAESDRNVLIVLAVIFGLMFLMMAVNSGNTPNASSINSGGASGPQSEMPTPLAFLCTSESYRQRMIEDEIDEVEQRNGDKFDEEAARKRVLAISETTLEARRQSDLAFARNVDRDAHKPDPCPNQ